MFIIINLNRGYTNQINSDRYLYRKFRNPSTQQQQRAATEECRGTSMSLINQKIWFCPLNPAPYVLCNDFEGVYYDKSK